MARNKNALRQHYVAEVPSTGLPDEGDYKLLAQWISDISDETDENVESTAFYDGDGTPTSDVTSVAMAWSFEGFYDSANEAQALIQAMKLLTGDGRKIYHKIIESDGTKQYVGVATVTDIVTGGGAAEDYEEFSCTITYDKIPTYEDVTTESTTENT
jgi:hypothetical protein